MLVFGLLVSGSIDRQAFAQETANIDPVASDAVQAHSAMQDFELDNTHSSLLFAVSHAGLSYTYGRFENCSGQIHLADDPAETYFRFEIEVASINTNNRLRDDHLRGPEFFDVKQFPKIMFQSTKVERDQSGARFNVTGTMSMHGSPKKITMPINMIGVGKGPMGKTRGGFMTKFTLQRSDFGIDALPKVIGDQIAITFSFEGILSPPPTATK
jgi:polyisoprenoid-binding protein YceI